MKIQESSILAGYKKTNGIKNNNFISKNNITPSFTGDSYTPGVKLKIIDAKKRHSAAEKKAIIQKYAAARLRIADETALINRKVANINVAGRYTHRLMQEYGKTANWYSVEAENLAYDFISLYKLCKANNFEPIEYSNGTAKEYDKKTGRFTEYDSKGRFVSTTQELNNGNSNSSERLFRTTSHHTNGIIVCEYAIFDMESESPKIEIRSVSENNSLKHQASAVSYQNGTPCSMKITSKDDDENKAEIIDFANNKYKVFVTYPDPLKMNKVRNCNHKFAFTPDGILERYSSKGCIGMQSPADPNNNSQLALFDPSTGKLLNFQEREGEREVSYSPQAQGNKANSIEIKKNGLKVLSYRNRDYFAGDVGKESASYSLETYQRVGSDCIQVDCFEINENKNAITYSQHYNYYQI